MNGILYKTLGALSIKSRWRYGNVRIVLADDFRKKELQREYYYLKGMYPGAIELLYDLPADGSKRNYLSDLTLKDKLIIVSKASSTGLNSMNYKQLVDSLTQAGLRYAGVIKLHACHIGEGNWLYCLGHTLKAKGVSYSYLCGPKRSYIYEHFPFRYSKGEYKIIPGNVRQEFTGTRYIHNNLDSVLIS